MALWEGKGLVIGIDLRTDKHGAPPPPLIYPCFSLVFSRVFPFVFSFVFSRF
jgi:hypothetical protein